MTRTEMEEMIEAKKREIEERKEKWIDAICDSELNYWLYENARCMAIELEVEIEELEQMKDALECGDY